MSETKHIDWETDEYGQQIGKYSVSTEAALNRWQEAYDAINALEARIKVLETKQNKSND